MLKKHLSPAALLFPFFMLKTSHVMMSCREWRHRVFFHYIHFGEIVFWLFGGSKITYLIFKINYLNDNQLIRLLNLRICFIAKENNGDNEF